MDFLLARLLTARGGVLWAEYLRGAGRATVTLRRDLDSPDHEVLIDIEHEGLFRAMLAYLATKYADNQVYGGHAEPEISCDGIPFRTEMFFANRLGTGFWFRISAVCLAESIE